MLRSTIPTRIIPQTLLIIGDVHGCFHTFRSLIEKCWQPETMRLIQLGDLTDRGNYIPETIAFVRLLEQQYPEAVTFLKGNHEVEVVARWRMLQDVHSKDDKPSHASYYVAGNSTLKQYFVEESVLERLEADMLWLEQRPCFWENDGVFVSHAGIAEHWRGVEEALVEDHPEGILWTRSPLKNIGKVQVIGHTPRKTGEPEFREAENCWNIDTGAVFGLNLTGLHLASDGTVLEVFMMPTEKIDYS
jgi:serine/threonine protein phosphatase 1